MKNLLKTTNKKKTYECPYCQAEIKPFSLFCNKRCKTNHFQFINTHIPFPFVRRIYYYSDVDTLIELRNYASRHKINTEVVIKRFNLRKEEYKKINNLGDKDE